MLIRAEGFLLELRSSNLYNSAVLHFFFNPGLKRKSFGRLKCHHFLLCICEEQKDSVLSKSAVLRLGLVLGEVTLLGTVEHCKSISSLVLCLERLGFFPIMQINCVFSSPVWFECFVVAGGFLFRFFLQHAGA